MQSRNLKIGILVLAAALVLAAILGVGLGQDFTDGYLIRINSAEAFTQEAADAITQEFGSSLGELRVQYAKEHYSYQLLIHAQKATQDDADKMVQIAGEANDAAYLRGFDKVSNPAGKHLFWKYAVIMVIVYMLGTAYVWYRQGRSGGVAALAAGSAAVLMAIAMQSVAGLYLSETSFLGIGVLSMSFAQMMSYLLNDSADAKAGLLDGESADTLAKRAWLGAKSKVIILTAVTVIFALSGCVVATGELREYMTSILMGACAAALMAVLIGLPTYVLFAQKHMLKGNTKKKTKAIK